MNLVFDGYNTDFTLSEGYTGYPATLSSMTPAADSYVWETLFRHSPEKNVKKGPDMLYADGHVEKRVNLLILTDDNFSVPLTSF
jgi:prepilin-type processing-associated H-X9-DG protein